MPILILLLLLFTLAPATAESCLLIPFVLTGDELPVDEQAAHTMVTQAFEKLAPQLELKFADRPEQALTRSDALRMGREAGVDYVIWGTVNFSQRVQTIRMTGGAAAGASNTPVGQPTRYLVTVAGAAEANALDVQEDKLLARQPTATFESDTTAALLGTPRFREVQDKLARSCVRQLAYRLLTSLKQEVANPREQDKDSNLIYF